MAAAGFSAGQYVLVPLPGKPQQSWPGVVCTDDMVDMVPEANRENGLNGYELPVLLRRAHTLGVVYASAGALRGLDPEDQDAISHMDADRRAAYSEIFDYARDVHYPDLDYWRDILATGLMLQSDDYSSDDSIILVEEADAQPGRKRKQDVFMPQSRSSQPKTLRINPPILSLSAETRDTKDQIRNTTPVLGIVDSQNRHSDHEQSTQEEYTTQSLDDRSQTQGREPEPVDREWATFYIGKDEKEFIVPFAHVQKFDCFKEAIEDADTGICVRRPAFAKIDPKNFEAVSMFISNEDFYPLFKQDSAKDHFVDDMPTQAEKNVAMTQCIQAWKVSCEIPFEEMMEMTLRKIKALKDSKAFILYLSKVVFAEPSYDLDAETQLREFLISEIHDNIWPDMNEQGNVRDAFLKCPDLMTAVAERIREAREPRTDPDEGA